MSKVIRLRESQPWTSANRRHPEEGVLVRIHIATEQRPRSGLYFRIGSTWMRSRDDKEPIAIRIGDMWSD